MMRWWVEVTLTLKNIPQEEFDGWIIKFPTSTSSPQQQGNNDCGVYTCQCARNIFFSAVSTLQFDFSQQNMKFLRNEMVLQLYHGRLKVPFFCLFSVFFR